MRVLTNVTKKYVPYIPPPATPPSRPSGLLLCFEYALSRPPECSEINFDTELRVCVGWDVCVRVPQKSSLFSRISTLPINRNMYDTGSRLCCVALPPRTTIDLLLFPPLLYHHTSGTPAEAPLKPKLAKQVKNIFCFVCSRMCVCVCVCFGPCNSLDSRQSKRLLYQCPTTKLVFLFYRGAFVFSSQHTSPVQNHTQTPNRA